MGDENRVKYGLSNVHYAKADFDDYGNVTYDTPVKIPGAVSLSMDAEGEVSRWYADNMGYVVMSNNSGYSGDLEVALLPESFYTDILHEELDENGAMAEKKDVEVEHFALMFQFEGDVYKTRHVLYNCVCTRPAIASATTEDTKEPQTDTLSLTAMALPNGQVKGKTCSKTPSTVYDDWFDEVYEHGGPVVVTHTVEFYNGDVLLQTVTVEDGKRATYSGSTPVSADDPDAPFIGWDPEPTNVTEDMKCYAQYAPLVYTSFSVRFHPVDIASGDDVASGNVTISAVDLDTGKTVYSQTKTLEYSSSYVSFDTWSFYDDFDSWADLEKKYDVEIAVDGYRIILCSTGTSKNSSGNFNVQYNITQLQTTATFTVYFYNGSTLLQTVTDVEYGGSATYTGETPINPDDPIFGFVGWDPEPTNITSDTKCYAQFRQPPVANFRVAFRATNFETEEEIPEGDVTLTLTKKATGEVVYTQTYTMEYSTSYKSFGSWTADYPYDSWQDVEKDYTFVISVEDYVIILSDTMSTTNSSGNFNLWIDIINVLPVDSPDPIRTKDGDAVVSKDDHAI